MPEPHLEQHLHGLYGCGMQFVGQRPCRWRWWHAAKLAAAAAWRGVSVAPYYVGLTTAPRALWEVWQARRRAAAGNRARPSGVLHWQTVHAAGAQSTMGKLKIAAGRSTYC